MKLALPKFRMPKLRLPAALVARLPAGLAARLRGADPRDDLQGFHPNHQDDPFGPLDDDDEIEPLPRWKRLLPWCVVGAVALAILAVGLGGWFWLSANRLEIVEARATSDPAVILSGAELAAQFARQRAQEAEIASQLNAQTQAQAQGTAPTGEQTAAASTEAPAGDADPGQDPPDPFKELMAPHPDNALIENSDIGPLPRVAADGRKAWKVYSRPSNAIETRPRIAIVVLGLGRKRDVTERAVALPGVVTLGFSPNAPGLGEWIAGARDAGHEVLIGLPMEPTDFPRNDAGPEALMTALSGEQNLTRLKWLMSRGTGYIGFVNTQGQKFLDDPAAFRPIAEEMASRGLMFLEASQGLIPAALSIGQGVGLPMLASGHWVDATLSRAGVEQALAELETRARTNGQAIGLMHPYPVAFGRLRTWIRTLNGKGLALVPLSALVEGPPS